MKRNFRAKRGRRMGTGKHQQRDGDRTHGSAQSISPAPKPELPAWMVSRSLLCLVWIGWVSTGGIGNRSVIAQDEGVLAETRIETAAETAGETVTVEGLEHPVEILVDRWGVPHIYAQSEEDLFFAQGYYAARDRLFQFELWRRQATGTVAEILGPRELDRDRGARLLQYRGDLEKELNHYHPRGASIIRAFTRGSTPGSRRPRSSPSCSQLNFAYWVSGRDGGLRRWSSRATRG
jgi:hypothetical protein